MKGKARRLLSWVCVLALCMSLLPVTALAAGGTSETRTVSTDADSPVQITKTLSGSGTTEDPYELTMEAYVGGTVTPSSTVPLDIVLVLDQSGSMEDPFSFSENVRYEELNRTNREYYTNQQNLWHSVGGNYVPVTVSRSEQISYVAIPSDSINYDSGWFSSNNYWEHKDALYQKISDSEYQKVTVERDRTSWRNEYTYTYTFADGTSISSQGDNSSPDFGSRGPLYRPGDTTYTYTYSYGDTDICTSSGSNVRPVVQLYRKTSTTESVSRLTALKNAASAFVNSVQSSAIGTDKTAGTDDDVNHRIAVVGFAYGPSSYSNTELFIGSTGYTYGRDANSEYSSAFQDMNSVEGAKNVTSSINALTANGATYVDYGLEMAGRILEENPVNENEARERVVIVFTDGSPGQNGTWGDGRNGGDADETADDAIARASEIKEIGATIYTVGVFPGADAASPIPAFTNDNNHATSNANRFMHLVSSNYPSAEDMSNPGEINPDLNGKSFYLSASNADSLNSVFNEIAEEIQPTVTVDKDSVLSDTLSAYFDFGNISVGDSNIVTEGVTVQKVEASGTGQTPNWSSTPGDITDDVTVTVNQETGKIEVTGFDYSAEENVVVQKDGTWQGHKLVITFPIAVDTVACLEATDIQNNLYPTNSIADGSKAGLTYGESSTLLIESPTVKLENLTANGTDVTVQVYVDGELVANPQEYVTLSRDTTDTTYNYFHLVSTDSNGTLTYDFDYNPDPESGHDCVDISVEVTGNTYLLQGITSYQSHGKNGTGNVIAKGDTYTVDNVTHNDSDSPDVKIFLRTKYSVQYYQNETLLQDTYVDEMTYLAGEDVSSTTEKNNYPTTEAPVQMNWKNTGYSTTISLKGLPNEEGLTVDGWFLGSTTGTEYDPSSGTSINVSAVSDNAENNVIKFYATSEAITPTITVSVTNGTAKSGSDFTLDSTSDTASTGTFTVAYEGSATIIFAPQEGYALDSVKVNDAYVAFDVLNNGTYAFSDVIKDQSIEVVYALDENDDGVPDKHQATVTYQVVNGTWDGKDNANKENFFTIEQYNPNTGNWDSIEATLGNTIPENMQPSEGFTEDGTWDQEISSETQVTGDVTYTYTFGDKLQYTITVEVVNGRASAIDLSATEDGDASVYHGTVSAEYGADVTINFQGDTGYALDSVTVDDQTAALTGESNYTFNDVSANHTIQVVYEADENKDNIPDKYQVTVNYVAETGGTITGQATEVLTIKDGAGKYAESGTVTATGSTATADEGYFFNKWTKAVNEGNAEDTSLSDATGSINLGTVKGGDVITFTAYFTEENPKVNITKELTSVTRDGQQIGDLTAYTAQVGDELTYTITVINNGNITLETVTVEDEFTGSGTLAFDVPENVTVNGNTLTISNLSNEEGRNSVSITATYTVQPDDISKDTIVNTANAYIGEEGGDPDDTAEETVRMDDYTVTITPADITIYTGGEDYSGVVDGSGNLIGSTETNTGLPEPGYHITLPAAVTEWLNDKEGGEGSTGEDAARDLANYMTFTYDVGETTREWGMQYQGVYSTNPETGEVRQYVYSLTAGKTEDNKEIPVRLQFKNGDQVMTSDDFDMSAAQVHQTYDMTIYSGELEQGQIKAKLTVGEEGTEQSISCDIKIGSGELTIRSVVDKIDNTNAIAADENAVTDTETATAVPNGDVDYYVNDSKVEVKNEGDRVQLLVDQVSDNTDFNAAMGNDAVAKVNAALEEGNTLSNAAYDLAYMDLVDTQNGNTVVTMGDNQSLFIYWPVPEDAAEDSAFHVVHYYELDREEVTNADDLGEATTQKVDTKEVNGQSYVVFETSSFSPFALVYEKAPDPVASLDVTKTLTAVNGKTPGSSVSVGDTLTYTITVKNGEVALKDVTITDTFTGKGDLNFRLPDGATVSENQDGTYTITLGDLTAGQEVTITATYKVLRADASSDLTNAVKVNGTNPGGGENPTDEDKTPETPVNPYHPPIRPPVDPDKPELNTEDHYAYIVGYEDGSVQPEGDITRAEVATIFFRLLTDESRNEYWSQTNPYSDVSADDWFNNAVSTLTNAGVLDGYEDGTFKPNGNITRAEFATITARFFEATYDGENLFPDIEGHWAQDYINEAANAGIVDGYPDGTFGPQKLITRAEAMTMVNRTIDRHPHEDHLLADMIVWPDNPETAWYYEQVQEATNSHEYTMNTDDEQNPYEIWTKLLPNRDWSELEKEWSDANDGAGSGEVV